MINLGFRDGVLALDPLAAPRLNVLQAERVLRHQRLRHRRQGMVYQSLYRDGRNCGPYVARIAPWPWEAGTPDHAT